MKGGGIKETETECDYCYNLYACVCMYVYALVHKGRKMFSRRRVQRGLFFG